MPGPNPLEKHFLFLHFLLFLPFCLCREQFSTVQCVPRLTLAKDSLAVGGYLQDTEA